MKNRLAWLATVLAVSGGLAGGGWAADAPKWKSGKQVGEFIGPFEVLDVTGPNKGTYLCYRCAYSPGPVVCVVASQPSSALTSLVKQIDAQVSKSQQLKGFVVVMGEDEQKTSGALKQMAEKDAIKNVPLTTLRGSPGPPTCQIDKDAEVTVMLWDHSVIKANHAFKKGELNETGIKAVLADLPKILGH